MCTGGAKSIKGDQATQLYRGTSPRKRTLLGPYRRLMPRVIGWWAFSCGRGTPVQLDAVQLSGSEIGCLSVRAQVTGKASGRGPLVTDHLHAYPGFTTTLVKPRPVSTGVPHF